MNSSYEIALHRQELRTAKRHMFMLSPKTPAHLQAVLTYDAKLFEATIHPQRELIITNKAG